MKLRFAAVTGLVVLPAFPALASTPTGDAISIVSGEGVVERASSGARWTPAKGRLHRGWEVRCPTGCALAMPKRGALRLEPGAEIRDRIAMFVHTSDVQAERAMGIELRAGAIRVDLARSAEGMVVASGDGAEMFIAGHGAGGAVAHGGHPNFAATSLTAHVRAAHGRWQPLTAGRAISVQGVLLGAERGLPGAPKWQLSGLNAGPVGLAGANGSGRVGGVWSTASGAKGYAIEIARDAAFGELVSTRTVDTNMASEDLTPGNYFARVAALDGDGLAGPVSTTRTLRVVAVTIPAGGVADVDTRTLIVPAARALQIHDSDGVEFGLGKPSFQPASALDLSLSDKTERLWMRLRGDMMSESAFTLEPRALRAEVEISPRNARWPADPIDVTVRITDPSHRIDPASFTPKLRAMLEVDDLPVTWTHDGAVWKAHLAPHPIITNTVVRIEAMDEHDNLLGRGFAEIEPTRMAAFATR